MTHARLLPGLLVAAALVGCAGEAAAPDDREQAAGAATNPASEGIYFAEMTDRAGIEHAAPAAPDTQYFLPNIMSGGAALLDYDGDGDLDICLTGGSREIAPPDGGESPHPGPPPQGGRESRPVALRGHVHLLRQESDGTFTDVTGDSGLALETYGVGLAVGDIDNDGDLDLYFTNYGPGALFENNGDGTFTDITQTSGASNRAWGTAACFFDYNLDGWLDLFVANYLDYYPSTICEDGRGRPDYCGPTSFLGTPDRLFRNEGPAGAAGESGQAGSRVRFTDVTVEAGLASTPGKGLGVICRDLNGDSLPDIYVANDMEANRLWIQQADGTFRDEAAARGAAYNRLGEPEASMGVVAEDFHGDGQVDLFMTHLDGQTNTFYRGLGGGVFLDDTAASGLGPPSRPFTGFGVVAADFEHDGDLDLAIANGGVQRGSAGGRGEAERAPANGARQRGTQGDFWADYAMRNQVFLNEGAGRFRDASGETGDFCVPSEVSRALAAGDLDGDGDVDLLVTNVAGRTRLYRNVAPKRGAWLMVRAVDPRWRRDAVGARIAVEVGGRGHSEAVPRRRFEREVNPSYSYLSSNDFWVHFGLGPADAYDGISVQWPDGATEVFPGGATCRRILLRRGTGSFVVAAFRRSDAGETAD